MTSYNLEVEDGLWQKFKGTVPKNRTLNDEIEQLIEEKVDNNA